MTYYAQQRRAPRRRSGHNPLVGPLALFLAVLAGAAVYVAYVLWPRWPQIPVSLDAPSLPIVIAGTAFNIEPAAIRVAMQRRPGTQDRVDLVYLWPSLAPPDPAEKLTPENAPARAAERRLFVTIAASDGTLPPMERLKTIYPRYLATAISDGPPGLALRPFRDDTPYKGEELIYDPQAPEHFLARCTQHGVTNSGTCLLERRIGEADITLRFPRDWLSDWHGVVGGIDKLLARLHAG